jgi:hypothetical protein
MTLNSLEVTECGKNYFILFSLLYLQNFIICTFSIFIIIFGRTCYGTTVPHDTKYHFSVVVASQLVHLCLWSPI